MVILNRISDGLFQLKVPFISASQWTNCYLVQGAKGYTVIDCGFSTKSTQNLWMSVLKELDIRASDIEQIIVTHHHIDHMVLVSWLQKLSGAPVMMSERAYRHMLYTWSPGSTYIEDFQHYYEASGIPEGMLARLMISVKQYQSIVKEFPEVTFLSDRDRVEMGKQVYTVYETQGHAEGHLNLYCNDNKWMFCGDQLLEDTIPNLNLNYTFEDNPLQGYLESLAEFVDLEIELALPGHGEPFANVRSAINRTYAHYQAKLDQVLSICASPCTPFEIYTAMNSGPVVPARIRYELIGISGLIRYLIGTRQMASSSHGTFIALASLH